jgi:predicted alpha/beta-fold hydrolase
LDTTSITIYKDIAYCIQKRYKEAQWTELIVIGFSAGGIIASHIMSQLSKLSCSKKIITYDTPYQIMDNVARFQKNWFYRLDYLFFVLAYCIYKRSTQENMQGNMISLKQIVCGYGTASELFAMVQRIHSYTYDNIYYLSSFNMDQDVTTKVISISNQYDPVLYKETHYRYLNQKATEGITLPSLTHIVKKGTIGHCSDMAFDREYLKYIVEALCA